MEAKAEYRLMVEIIREAVLAAANWAMALREPGRAGGFAKLARKHSAKVAALALQLHSRPA